MDHTEHQADRKDVEPGEVLLCAAISADSTSADHRSQCGGNREPVAEVCGSPSALPVEPQGSVVSKRQVTSALKELSTEALMHELERRQFAERRERAKVRHRWVCDKCGNEVIGGGAFGSSYVEAGRVWCRVCDPYRPDFYGSRGPQSVPMRHVIEKVAQ